MSRQTALQLTAAGAVVGASGAAYLAYTSYAAKKKTDVVLFLDGSNKGLTLPREQSLALLTASIEQQLRIRSPRLFLLQLDGLPEITSSEDLAAAYSNTAACMGGTLLLLVTADGAAPSSSGSSGTAAAAGPLAAVPCGPRPLPVVGNMMLYFKGPMGAQGSFANNVYLNMFQPHHQAQWGDTVLLYTPAKQRGREYLEGVPAERLHHTIVTCDPEVVGELLARQDDFPKLWGRVKAEVSLQGFAGNGLFTSSTRDHDWQVAHGLLPRGFNQIRIKNYFGVLLDKTRSFVLAWDSRPSGALIEDVNDWLTCMTADAVTKAAMGLDMNNVENKASGAPLHKFIGAFRFGLKAALGRATVKGEFGTLAALNPFFDGKAALSAKAAEAAATSQEVVEELLERTRKGEIGGTNSVLSAMLNEVSPSTGDYVRINNIYGQVMNLMIAGHETTAATLGFTLYYIATHPEVEARVLEEIDAVLGSRFEPNVDDIPKLVYIEACFREALRLHPPVGQVNRDVAVDTTLKGKWFVRQGQRIEINNVALQRREDQWGGRFGDPNKYNPDRFMPGAAEETGRHPNAFNPWGFGIRACIGSQFALWEAKLFLAVILRCFRLVVPEGYVAVGSTADGGAAPSPHHLALYVYRRPGRESVLQGIKSAQQSAASLPVDAAAAADVPAKAGAAATAAAAGGGPAEGAHNTPLLVLYGSNMGTCEELAGQVAGQATSAGFKVKVAKLDSVVRGAAAAADVLPKSGAVLIISSTYNGTPPDNAAAFAKWLEEQQEGSLSGVSYAVFGVGNSQWKQTFQAFPKRMDVQLKGAGATQVLSLQSCDVDGNEWSDAFDSWRGEVVRSLLAHFFLQPPAGFNSGGSVSESPMRLQLQLLKDGEGGPALTLEQAVAALMANKPDGTDGALLKVLESRELQGPGSDRSTCHVTLQLPAGPAGQYRAGEHLEVYGNNDSALVDMTLGLLGLTGSERVSWVTNRDDSTGSARTMGGGQKVTITVSSRMVLTWLVDLAAVPSKRTVAALAESCPCPPEAAKLKDMATEEGYKAQVGSKRLTLVELLCAFRSVPVDLQSLANMLPRLGPRYYSISSSPLARPGTCSITVGKVMYTSPTGRVHKGAASATIGSKPVGGVLLGRVRPLSGNFKLPDDPSVPVIMVGPGTGVAPMMGFLQERAALQAKGAKLGPGVLFFGCRNSKDDFIYADELQQYEKSGVLSQLHVAFSRDGPSKVYVQDLIQANGAKLWPLFEAGAVVYICGDARRMAPDVRSAFKDIARTFGGRSDAAAESWLGGLLESNRYLEDVWAG